MSRFESAERINVIAEEMRTLLEEAKTICEEENMDMPNLNAYVFNQIEEHIENANPHNQSLSSIVEELNKGEACYGCGDRKDDVCERDNDDNLCEECWIDFQECTEEQKKEEVKS